MFSLDRALRLCSPKWKAQAGINVETQTGCVDISEEETGKFLFSVDAFEDAMRIILMQQVIADACDEIQRLTDMCNPVE